MNKNGLEECTANKTIIAVRVDGLWLGHTKEDWDEVSSLENRVSKSGRHRLVRCRRGAWENVWENVKDEEAGPSEGVREGESRQYRKATSERRAFIYVASAVGPCKHGGLTPRHTRLGRSLFPDAATASFVLQ